MDAFRSGRGSTQQPQFRNGKASGRESFSQVLRRVDSHVARPALLRLVSFGADRTTLLEKLHVLMHPARLTPERLLGMKVRQAQSLISSIRDIARRIELLRGVDWRPGTFRDYEAYLRKRAREAIGTDGLFPRLEDSWRESWVNAYSEYLGKSPRDYREEVMLPCLMRHYADALESTLKNLKFLRKHPIRTGALCQLIYHVKQTTGRWHDSEVRALVAAAENRLDDYDISAHAKWRSRHEKLIVRIGPFVPLNIYPHRLQQ